MDKKYKVIKNETMEIIGSQFENNLESRKAEVNKQIGEIKHRIELGCASRDEVVNFMVNNFGDKILELEENTQKEVEVRAQ